MALARIAALAALPAANGFADLKSFIKALKPAAGKEPPDKTGRKTKAPKVKKVKSGKRPRAKITDEIRARVKAAFCLRA